MTHTNKVCTRKFCPECNGRGEVLDAPGNVLEGRAYWTTCVGCEGQGTTKCGGCRADSGMDCMYDALALCSVCGALEGAQLPFCPGVALTQEQHDKHYAQYCDGTGPFARCTERNMLEVVKACINRYIERGYSEDYGGTRSLYAAVCDLTREAWMLDMIRKGLAHRGEIVVPINFIEQV